MRISDHADTDPPTNQNYSNRFGERSWRYSAIINDQVVEWIAVEQPRIENSGPDPYEVSGAESMLEHLNSTA